MSRIATVVVFGLLCQFAVAGPPADAPAEDQAVQAEPTSPPTADAASAETPEPTVIVDKVYRMFSAESDEDSEIGTFTIRAVETDQTVEVAVEITMDFRGESVTISTSVDYKQASGEPISGQAETFIGGEACMQGTIEFGETTYSYSGVGLLDARAGEALTPPLEFGETDLPMPAGPVVFIADFAVMAPRLLAEAGTLEDVIIFRVPDDIGAPELVDVQEGCQLVRRPADADGNVVSELYYPVPGTTPEGEPRIRQALDSSVTYNTDGEIVDYRPNEDDWRLVEVNHNEPAEDVQSEEDEVQPEEGDDD